MCKDCSGTVFYCSIRVSEAVCWKIRALRRQPEQFCIRTTKSGGVKAAYGATDRLRAGPMWPQNRRERERPFFKKQPGFP